MEISGLNIKINNNGTWVTPVPYVKVSDSWAKARRVYTKVAGSWHNIYEHEYVHTFSVSTHTDVDLDTLGLDKYHNVRVVIPSGATLVASTTSTYALKTGTGYGGTLTIENNGKILGRGGNGGGGGRSSSFDGYNGGAGGIAIHIESALTIDNNSTIAGGGSGGGGGAGFAMNGPSGFLSEGGSGGGGGAPLGLGGSGGTGNQGNGDSGATATLTTRGLGGTANKNGGNGGAYASLGGAGESYTDFTGGVAGAVGASYYNPNSFTVTQI